MKAMQRIPRIFAILILLSLVLTLSSAGVVGAQTDTPPSNISLSDAGQQAVIPQGGGPVSGGPGFVSISAYEFKPYTSTYGYQFLNTALSNPNVSSWEPYVATVQLPQGAVINQMVVYFLDNNANYDFAITLQQVNFFSSSVVNMVTINPVGANSSAWQYSANSTITQATVDNSRFAYAIRVDLPPNSAVQLNAVRIDYGYPTNLPVITK